MTLVEKIKNNVVPVKRSTNNRRYYLHRKVREYGLFLSVKDRTIYVPWNIDGLPKHVKMLRDEYFYSIQTQIV